MHAREGDDIDVLPFIPVCTACLMWTFAGRRWALHRLLPTTTELDAPPPSPFELIAVWLPGNELWLSTTDAESYELGDFRIYTWSANQLGAEPEGLDAADEDAEAASKPRRTVGFWIANEDDAQGFCTVPLLGGGPLPDEKPLAQLVDDLDIERQPCTDVM